jgi:hypothetical protein
MARFFIRALPLRRATLYFIAGSRSEFFSRGRSVLDAVLPGCDTPVVGGALGDALRSPAAAAGGCRRASLSRHADRPVSVIKTATTTGLDLMRG